MATLQQTRVQKGVRKSITSALLMLTLGGPSSVYATSSNPPPVAGPQAPPPQGILTVYSERYVMEDADVPVLSRRPVELYTSDGQWVGTYNNPVGDGPIRITVAPGHYQVVSESHWT